MKYLKWIVPILIFLIVGELLIRFEKNVLMYESDNVVKIPIKIGNSEEFNLLRENKIPLTDDILRIMVLGDSYINGGGIDFNKNFSHNLKSFLKKTNLKQYKKIYVLDLSRPSNNTLDNYKTYFQYIDHFKPQFVILGYNVRAVNGNLNKSDTLPYSKQTNKISGSFSKTKKIYDILYKSELIQLTLHNLHKYLKSYGYIIPNSIFDQELKSYTLNKTNWIKSKELFAHP